MAENFDRMAPPKEPRAEAEEEDVLKPGDIRPGVYLSEIVELK